MAQLPALCVAARAERLCSAQALFHVEDLPQLLFSAHAVEGGTVIIQQAPSGLHQLDPTPPVEQHQPFWLHYLGSGAPQQLPQHSSSTGQYSTVLIINDVAAHGDEPIQQLVWGGGPYHLLAAASKRSISIFSLLPFMASLKSAQEAAVLAVQQQQQPMQHHTARMQTKVLQQHHAPLQTVPELVAQQQQQHVHLHDGSSSSRKWQRVCYQPSIGYAVLPAYHLSSQPLDMQWTYDAQGLLLADVLGNIIMLQVSCLSLRQQRQQQQGGLPADASGLSAAVSTPQLQQQQWQLQELWRVRADQAQHLIAAGAWPTGAAATVSADSAQRVIVWWPSPDSKNPGAYKVGAEVIRHPVKAVQLQWSPPLPRSGAGRSSSHGTGAARSSGGGAGAAAAGGRGSIPGSPVGSPVAGRSTGGGGLPSLLPATAPAAAAASAGGNGGSSADGAGTVQDSSNTSGPVGQPALMTVGVDGVIRVFVEVVLSDIGPGPPAMPAAAGAAAGASGAKGTSSSTAASPAAAASAAAAAGSPGPAGGAKAAASAAATMSQFCLTLVIDPPGLGPQKGLGFKPGLTVTWARPLATPNPQQPQLLWLLASYVAPQQPQEPLPLAAALSGVTPQAAAAAAAAHGMMHPGMAVLQPPPAAGTGLAGSSSSYTGPLYQDHVYLWAVDGLAGVVLSGIAANAIMSNKICEPRAYLWGKDSSTLSWQHPSLLLQQAAAMHGLLSSHQHQQQRLQQQSGGGQLSAGSPSTSTGLGQLGVGFRHNLGAWVVESPAGPLLSVLQHYNAPLASSAGNGWTWHGVQQLLQHSGSSGSGVGSAAAGAFGWPLLGAGAAGNSSSSSSITAKGAVSEVRSFQVTPLTGVNEAGQPSSAIAVAATSSRASAGCDEEWVQVSIHTAADIAAAVGSSGAVAIWSLCPVQLLPFAPQQSQRQQQQQQQQDSCALPESWHSCKTCCWLTFGGATAAAAAAAAGLTGLPLLLAVHGNAGIDICLVTLSDSGHSTPDQHAQQQQQVQHNSGSSSSSSRLREPCITGVHVLLHLDTPAGVRGVKQLAEMGTCQVPIPSVDASTRDEQQVDAQQQQQQQGPEPLILQATLLGLGGFEPGTAADAGRQQQQQGRGQPQQLVHGQQDHQDQHQQQQQHPHPVMQRLLSDADRPDVPWQDAWVSWTLQVCLQQQQQQLPQAQKQAHGPFAAVSGVADQQQQQSQWPVQLHASAPTVTPIGVAVSPAQAAAAVAAAAADGSSDGPSLPAADVGAAISCLQCPSPASPFLVTGNAAGMLMLWQAASGTIPADGSADTSAAPASFEQSQSSLGEAGFSTAAAAAAAGADDGSRGPSMQLLQASGCSVGGVNLGGICVAVALCASAGYAAAAITCGQSELEDAVFIWCAEGSTHSNIPSSSSSHTHPLAGGSSGSSTPQALSPRAAAATAVGTSCSGSSGSGGPFVLDCLLPLEDTAASLAWLDTGGLPPLLAVGVASGAVEVYSRDRSGQWNTLACYGVGLSVNFIAANRLGLPLLVAGSQLLLLSNLAALTLQSTGGASSASSVEHNLPRGEANGAVSVAEAPSAAVAAAAGWDAQDANGAGPQTLAAALSESSSILASGHSGHPASWGLVNLCKQLHPLQPLKIPGGPAKGAWLSGADTVVATHAALAAAAGSSSLPLYHPDVLLLLLGQGRFSAAAHIIRCVLDYILRRKATGGQDVEAAAAAMAAGSDGSIGGFSVPLEALLTSAAQQGALVNAETVSRCCSFRDAVMAAALGQQSPAAAAGSGTLTAGTATAATAGPGGSLLAPGRDAPSSAANSPAGASGGLSRLGQKPAAAAATDWGPLKPAVAPAPASAAAVAAGGSALDTGMLDMSAFGDFGGGFGTGGDDDWDDQRTVAVPAADTQQQQQQQQQQQGSGGPLAPPAPAAVPSSSNALETGMLDMSAFGGFGDFGGMAEPESQQQQQQQAAPSDALATGLLDMSAFGFGADTGADAAAQQQQQQQQSQADGKPQQAAQPAAQSDQLAPAAAANGVPAQLLAKTLVQFPPAPKRTLVKPGVIGVGGVSATAAAAAGGNTPAQQLLLSRAEVCELHSVLGLPEARKQLAAGHSGSSSKYGGGGSGGNAQAYYSRLLGAAGAADDTGRSGYARSSSSKGTGVDAAAAAAAGTASGQQQKQHEGDGEVLALLGLNPSQGRQLCNIAAALSTRTFMGDEGAAADDTDYGGVVTSSTGPANAAALAASWASSSIDSSSYNSVNRHWPGLSRSSSSIRPGAAAGAAASSSDAGAALAIIAAPDAGFNAALFQEVDPAGRLFAVSVQAALLQLAAHAAATPAATASGGQQEREKRFSAAVARLFQPVSVSRNLTAPNKKGAALLAHYPAMPTPREGSVGAGSADAAGVSRTSGLRPPLSPNRQQQRSGGGGIAAGMHQGLRGAANGLGFGRSGSRSGLAMRSSMSVVSMLSFSSLKNESSIDGGSESGTVAAAAVAAQAGSRSWAAFMGLLPGVTPLLCLWALSSTSQASLLQVLLPLVPDGIEDQLAAAGVGAAAVVAEHANHHSNHRQGSGGGAGAAGGGFAAGSGQEQQVMSWPKLQALGAGLWLTDPTVLRSTAEALAKAQYAVAKDPHEPALMYAALGKKGVLQGLFRSSGNKKVADFLARDFSTPEGRAAASKNAFHLLGQHRHHLAAAFFVLAGSQWDAVSVLAHDAADPQLALFVARLLDTAAADTSSSSSSTAVSLQRRLIDSDLMPLAEADADPAAAALAAWIRSGDGAAAVNVLLSRMLASQLLEGLDPNLGLLGSGVMSDTARAVSGVLGTSSQQGSAKGAGTLSGSLSPTPGFVSSPSPQPQQGSEDASGPRHAPQLPSPCPAVLAQLPLLLHWIMSVGLDQLGGRLVSGGLVAVLHKLALRVARCAEVSGLPVAAAEALALADALGDPSTDTNSSSSSNGPDVLGQVLMLMWHARLAAAVLALQLLPAGAQPSRDGSNGSSADVAHWQAAVQEAMPLLQKLGLKLEPAAVAVVLARHAMALNPVLALPADPPGSGWCCDLPHLPQQQLVDGHAGTAAGAPKKDGWGPFRSSSGQAAALAVGAGPDAVLAVCLSRASSLTAPSAIASPTLLSRMGSAVTPSTAAAAPAAAGKFGGTAGAAAAAADGKLQLGAVSTGPGWGASAGQVQGAQLGASSSSSSAPGVLGLSWEVASLPGDRLAAVSVCSGAQFSCCLLQQQQQQGHQPHGHNIDGTRAAAPSPTTPRQRMSQPGRSLVRPRPIIYATKAAGMCPAELLAPSNLLSHWMATHQYQQARTTPRSAAAAGVHSPPSHGQQQQQQQQQHGSGLQGSPRVQPGTSPRALSPAAPYAASSAGSLSGFMSQVLDQLRWPPDPWVVGEYPTRRGGMSLGSAAVGHVQAATVAAHPNRPLFVSGSSTGRIYLWQFGDANCKAAYVPLASTAQISAPAKRLSAHEAVNTPHWGNPAAVRFSRSGARFGAVGEGGLVGLWRQDFISAVDGMGHAEWVGHCLSRSGTGIAFLGDTGSQVFVSGVGERGGAVVLVDTLAPPNAATTATMLSSRGAVPTTLCLVPTSSSSSNGGPGAVLVVGDDAGEVRGYDVRVLDATRPLWSTRQQQQQHQQQQQQQQSKAAAAAGGSSGSNGVTSLTCWDAAWMGGSSVVSVFDGCGSSGGVSIGDLVACGSKDGSISLYNAQTGSVVQRLSSAHYTERKGLLERVGLGGSGKGSSAGGGDDSSSSVVLRPRPAGAVPAAVSGVQACAEGLVSVGWDGVVRFAPFAQLLNEWSARSGDV